VPASLILPDGSHVHLDSDVSIGRGPENDLVLRSKTVSRRHALVTQVQGRWFVEDRGSYNGTVLNDVRIPPGGGLPLRHTDRLELGEVTLIFSAPVEAADLDTTATLQAAPPRYTRQLSPLQQQVVRLLCRPWLAGGSLETLPSNEEIAMQLGTPGATETVKAALRRAYAKAGLSHLPAHAKRRALCRVAREQGWI
jgi:hypothetical protein